jgi:hypothetical protein
MTNQYPVNPETGVWEGDWQTALHASNGDYAYHSTGGMISREEGNSYTVRTGSAEAVIAGDRAAYERTDIDEDAIAGALSELGMSSDGWSFE